MAVASAYSFAMLRSAVVGGGLGSTQVRNQSLTIGHGTGMGAAPGPLTMAWGGQLRRRWRTNCSHWFSGFPPNSSVARSQLDVGMQ